MSLLVAVPCSLVAAAAYGASAATQHSAANTGNGQANARGLLALLRNPRWLLGIAGDTVGLAFHLAALATGPVVLIQPLLVLALPISLPISRLLGGPRPTRNDFASCALMIIALGAFCAILRNPGDADVITVRPALITMGGLVTVGLLACAAVRRQRAGIRALVYGVVSGSWFGLVAVLTDAAIAAGQAHGIGGFTRADGLVPLIGIAAFGTGSLILTQIALQVGDLSASFPGNLTTDPVVGVVLGAWLLREDVPTAPFELVGYAACLMAIGYGAIRLARRGDRSPVAASG